ncbi:cyclo(L-leucyl-L-leucyl) synthase [Alphaproteobacteria bacterium]|nr:cyclo(L-leucyl-L-leucyl) synthase [Alphaproteobacteria bacterium]
MEKHQNNYSVICESEKSEKLFFLKEHVLIGISPFNSYFSEERMEKIFFWALNNFQEISVFIPDEISRYTLQAVGYTEDRARQKTKRQDRYLKHKAVRALVANKLSETEAESKIVHLTKLMDNEKYTKFYNDYLELYKNDESFKKGCLMTSKWVLENKDISEKISDESVNIAVQYFLAELPLYLNTPYIFSIPSSLFVYKDSPSDFLKKVYEDDQLVSHQQGCLTLKIDNVANDEEFTKN